MLHIILLLKIAANIEEPHIQPVNTEWNSNNSITRRNIAVICHNNGIYRNEFYRGRIIRCFCPMLDKLDYLFTDIRMNPLNASFRYVYKSINLIDVTDT